MLSVVELLSQKKYFISMKGVSDAEIQQAEEALGTCFANDYRDYLKAYGLASYEGHELTGLCTSRRLNVVDVTLHEREKNPNMNSILYVIEEANMDGVVIWQSSEGTIYQSAPGILPVMMYESFAEYINS